MYSKNDLLLSSGWRRFSTKACPSIIYKRLAAPNIQWERIVYNNHYHSTKVLLTSNLYEAKLSTNRPRSFSSSWTSTSTTSRIIDIIQVLFDLNFLSIPFPFISSHLQVIGPRQSSRLHELSRVEFSLRPCRGFPIGCCVGTYFEFEEVGER